MGLHLAPYVYLYLHFQFAYGVVCQYLLSRDGDFEGAETAAPSLWPVALALGLLSLLQVSDHHDGGRPLLPHQTPEVHQSLWQRT